MAEDSARKASVGTVANSANIAENDANGEGKNAQSKESEVNGEPANDDPLSNWKNNLHPTIRRIFDSLRHEMECIEATVKRAEKEVFKKEEEAFFSRIDDSELTKLQKRLTDEHAHLVESHSRFLIDRQKNKDNKRQVLQMTRDAKTRETRIRRQELLQQMQNEVKDVLTTHRHDFDLHAKHIDGRHERERAQLIAQQERKARDQKSLLEIETRSLDQATRDEVLKDFAYRTGHENSLNKIALDQLVELQQLEVTHRKEQFEAEAKALEASIFLKIHNAQDQFDLEIKQKKEYQREKQSINEARERIKVVRLDAQQRAEVKRLKAKQKIALRACARQQKQRGIQRHAKWKETSGTEANNSDSGTAGNSSTAVSSSSSNVNMNTAGSTSNMELNSDMRSSNSQVSLSQLDCSSTSSLDPANDMAAIEDMRELAEHELQTQATLQAEMKLAEDALAKVQDALKLLLQRQKEEMLSIRKDQVTSMKELDESNRKEMEELCLAQESEIRSLKKSHQVSMQETMAAQQREQQMEASIRAAERHTMTERRTLNSVLDNVMDAIINIDTSCKIIRVNKAVERMFGYTADELLSKNVKILVPEPLATNHDNFVRTYLCTRIPRLIGTGRKVEGRHKSGALFPLYISLSEVREEDFHIFTGVLRDLTETVRAEMDAKAEEERKSRELEKFMEDLDVARQKSKRVIESILPPMIAEKLLKNIPVPPQSYNDCTILFTDICGFTELSSTSDPLEIVDLLNDIYGCFDTIIDQYDVFKVETIGDSYMVASGIPNPNGDRHLAEIAKLALHLLKAVQTIRIRHRPSSVLRMRLGIHTGPVVSGVVGRKMPRYCLFGDTVAIASRMESAGLPMKIQISETTYRGLEKIGGFNFESRGEMQMPGRPSVKTYFLVSKDDFDPEVPQVNSANNPLHFFLNQERQCDAANGSSENLEHEQNENGSGLDHENNENGSGLESSLQKAPGMHQLGSGAGLAACSTEDESQREDNHQRI